MSMDINIKVNETVNETKGTIGFTSIVQKTWSFFLSHGFHAFAMAAIYINIIIISNIMWPGEPFRSTELGLLVGFATYIMAISGLFFGYLADRISRVKLISISSVFFGAGLFVNGFAPEGLGFTTYVFFMICILVRGFFTGGFWPITNSYINDASAEEERSQFYGALDGTFQIIQIFGMVISAVIFQSNMWRMYFWIVGLIVVIFGFVNMKGKEPKRAANQAVFQEILSNKDIIYEYHLTKETIKKTFLSPTNIIAFVEGIFTTIILSVPDFLLMAYIQTSPHNISPLSTSLFMIVFGLPGGILGAVLFAKISDRLGKKNIKYRIYLITISLFSMFLMFIIIFSVPLPHLTVDEGNNIGFLFSFPVIWVIGIGVFLGRSLSSLYSMNQPPILQKINLPEAQGTISSTNQFLEMIGAGTGPILAGILLAAFTQDYQMTVIITMSIGAIGPLIWLFATIWIDKDVKRISTILKKRRIELELNNGMKIATTSDTT